MESWRVVVKTEKINLLNHKYLIKLSIEIIEKYKMTYLKC